MKKVLLSSIITLTLSLALSFTPNNHVQAHKVTSQSEEFRITKNNETNTIDELIAKTVKTLKQLTVAISSSAISIAVGCFEEQMIDIKQFLHNGNPLIVIN